MSKTIRLKKGFDIRLEGIAEKRLAGPVGSSKFGVRPVDFPGLIPKLDVKPGDEVKAGSPLFHDKLRPDILFTSPVSGKVISVDRGERRKILQVVIEKSGDGFVDFGKSDPEKLQYEVIREKLLKSGLWPVIRQRPYHVIANPADKPKSVFISGFDTSPLAPDYDFIIGKGYVPTFTPPHYDVISNIGLLSEAYDIQNPTNSRYYVVIKNKGNSGGYTISKTIFYNS